MADYTIANIPTQYRGRMYRSRLEARWAAFFDRLGWTHEYEPFDLGVWSPDFAITAPFDALVEVKPITEFDPEVAKKMCVADQGEHFLLLTRLAPVGEKVTTIGWCCRWMRLNNTFSRASILWWPKLDRPGHEADIMAVETDDRTWFTAGLLRGSVDKDRDQFEGTRLYHDYTMGLWADACNAVQWEPGP